MSLQAWLPLNGDLHNQGLSNITVTSYGSPTVDNNGKIGKCYSFDGTDDYLSLDGLNFGGLSEFSIAFWCKPTNTSLINAFQMKVSSGGNVAFQFNEDNGFSFRDSRHASLTSVYFNTPVAGEWAHYTFIYDKGNWRIYKNGETDGSGFTATQTATFYSNTTVCYVCSRRVTSGNYYFNGLINDVRIYNHALSPKEVEEIAKGLVLHYKLDDRYIEGTTNLCQSLIGGKETSVSNGVITTTGNNADTYWYIKPKEAFVGGDIYTVSCYVTGFNNSTTSLTFGVGSQSGNNCAGYWTLKNGYNTFTFTMPAGKNGSTENFLFDDNGGSRTQILTISKVQLEKKDHATPFIDYGTTRTPTTVYDSSGYSNNGTIVGSLTAATGSPRYDCATYIDGTGPYINSNNRLSFITNNSPFTIAIWVYCEDWTTITASSSKFIIQQYNGTNGGFRIYSGSGANRYRIYWVDTNGTARAVYFSANNALTTGWYFFTATYDGTVMTTYLNGKRYTSATYSYKNTTSAPKLLVGYGASSVPGKYSDLRIYATALTAAQVKELYTTSMSIDSSGNIHARELVEL